MTQDPIVIVGMARTPVGSFQGALADVKAPALGAAAIESALQRAGVPAEDVSEVIMGCVLPAGMGQAPARQAAHGAGVPRSVGATTINKMCGSGMRAAMFGHDQLVAGSSDVVVAGGLESMTNAPYLLDKARGGYRMGNGKIYDHMFLDGLEDAYEPGKLMGAYAEDTAQHYQFTRAAQDDFAAASLSRAKKANEDGSFDREMAAVTVKTRKGETVVDKDEQPFKANVDKISNSSACLPRGRHRDGGELELNLGRRGGACVDARIGGGATRPHAPRANRRPRNAQPGAGVVHHGAHRRHAETVRQDGLVARRHRPIRDQRGLRGRHHGGHARSRPAERQSQHSWWRLRAWSSRWCLGRAHYRDAIGGTGKA